jgi:predicted aspartyl protease
MLLLALAVALLPVPAEAMPVPTIPPATLDDALEITGDAIDAKQIRTRMFIDVAVNGRGPFRFLVDSGADRSVVGSGIAARLALPPGPQVNLQSMAGPSTATTAIIDTLKIGNSEIYNINAPVLPEIFIGAQGVLGIDALAEQRLMLDFDLRQVTIQDSRRPPPREEGEIVVTARLRKGQLILTQASSDGRSIYAVIDTGSEITVGNMALRARAIRSHARTHPITLISVTGQSTIADLAIMPEIRIGGVILRNVPVAFADVPPFALFGLARPPALLLGTDVLASFRRVSLDFHNRKVRFVLRRGTPMERLFGIDPL